MGVFEFVFLIFLILKLTNKVDWSWWVVCSPLLIELALLLMVMMFFGVATAAAFLGPFLLVMP